MPHVVLARHRQARYFGSSSRNGQPRYAGRQRRPPCPKTNSHSDTQTLCFLCCNQALRQKSSSKTASAPKQHQSAKTRDLTVSTTERPPTPEQEGEHMSAQPVVLSLSQACVRVRRRRSRVGGHSKKERSGDREKGRWKSGF